MTRPNKRLDDLVGTSTTKGIYGMPKTVENQLLDFAHWRLPHAEAVTLIGEAQLDEWRHRLINLVRWNCARRSWGERPGMGDAIQIASQIASHPPHEELPDGLDARMTRTREAYLRNQNPVTINYLVIALLGTTLLGGPEGMTLRRWIADEAPDAWNSAPLERDGYHYEVWLGPRSNPHIVVQAILAMEDEQLGKPWNAL